MAAPNHVIERTQQQPVDRSIIMRPGVGAVGRIVQRAQLTSHKVTVEAATLILVQSGQKCIRWSLGECLAAPGDAIAIAAGEVVDITNTPDPAGAYGARWMTWTDEAVDAFSKSGDGLLGAALLQQLSAGFLAAYLPPLQPQRDEPDADASSEASVGLYHGPNLI